MAQQREPLRAAGDVIDAEQLFHYCYRWMLFSRRIALVGTPRLVELRLIPRSFRVEHVKCFYSKFADIIPLKSTPKQ